MATAAEYVSWVFEAEVARNIGYLAREKLACGHKGNAVVAIVDHTVLKQRVIPSVYVDAVRISSTVRRTDGQSGDPCPNVAM
jgi:hypothetical protein